MARVARVASRRVVPATPICAVTSHCCHEFLCTVRDTVSALASGDVWVAGGPQRPPCCCCVPAASLCALLPRAFLLIPSHLTLHCCASAVARASGTGCSRAAVASRFPVTLSSTCCRHPSLAVSRRRFAVVHRFRVCGRCIVQVSARQEHGYAGRAWIG